jgi:Flp pilus assembly protein TadG
MIKKLIASLHQRGDDRERGTITIEFAFAAPILIMLALGAADFGSLMNTSAALRGATRAGAEYARANWNNPSVTDPTTSTEQQVCGFFGSTLSNGSCSPITPPVTPRVTTSCTCADNPATSVTCPGSTDPNPCAANAAGPQMLVYASVTAQQDFTPIVSWDSFVFSSPLNASTVVRTQ